MSDEDPDGSIRMNSAVNGPILSAQTDRTTSHHANGSQQLYQGTKMGCSSIAKSTSWGQRNRAAFLLLEGGKDPQTSNSLGEIPIRIRICDTFLVYSFIIHEMVYASFQMWFFLVLFFFTKRKKHRICISQTVVWQIICCSHSYGQGENTSQPRLSCTDNCSFLASQGARLSICLSVLVGSQRWVVKEPAVIVSPRLVPAFFLHLVCPQLNSSS